MTTRLFAALMAFSLVVAACGSTGEAAPSTTTTPPPTTDPGNRTETFTPGEVVTVDLPKANAQVTSADVAAVVAGDNQFGLDLFELVAGDDNLMVSPYSIATALSMLYPGARGATASEIADVLNITVDDATLHAVRNHLDSLLSQPAPPMSEEDTRQPFTIRPTNSAWGQGGYPFLDDYLAVLAENYGAGLRLLDYAGDPEGSRAIINRWVEEVTEDRIKDLVPAGAIDPLTRLVLVNAIWFKANWFEQFPVEATSPDPFFLLDGSEVEVPFMRASLPLEYAETDRYEAVRLPYTGDAAMVVLLPKQGTPVELAAVLAAEGVEIPWQRTEVAVTLPSFEYESTVDDLAGALAQLGMPTVFVPPVAGGDTTADLTGISSIRELYVSDVIHKSFIAVDEEGTEAAAATAVIIRATSGIGGPTPEFTADHPFLYWIEHSSTGEMLFLGQVTNPA
jgi:serpin B